MLLAAFAASLTLFPAFSVAEPRHVPILQRSGRPLTARDHFATAERTRLRYGLTNRNDEGLRDRAATEIDITNESTDQYYYTEVSIGNPAQKFKVMMDTSTSDIWVGGTTCSGCPANVPLYDHSKSSTSLNDTTVTTATYGPGTVEGDVFTDIIGMGSYSIPQSEFVAASKVTQDLIASPISGIIGLAFPGLAKTGKPFWQSILASDQSATPEMGFWLSRFRGTNNPASEEPGGIFTFGGVNTSLYSGDIEYLDLTGTAATFWSLDVSAINVQGKAISVNSSTKLAFFDTATTTIAGPPADVKAIWDAVPGSIASTTQDGFYEFPCDTNVSVTVSFGGRTWPISSVDMNMGPTSNKMCLGGIFGLSSVPVSVSIQPSWIFGVTFLKNVYTVFRQTPPAVGFAELSTLAGGTGIPASQASGSATGTASGSSTSSTAGGPAPNSDGSPSKKKSNIGPIVGGVIGGLALVVLIAAVLLYRRRRQSTTNAAIPFVGEEEGKSVEPVRNINPEPSPMVSLPASSPTPTRQSFSTMKREQVAAVHRYGDARTTTNSVVQTREGAQLSPGRGPASDVSSSLRAEDSVSRVDEGPGPSRPSGAQAPRPPATVSDPAVLLELQNLREEMTQMRRLVAEREREPPEAPPSYDHGD